MPSRARLRLFVLTEEFSGVFDEADEDDHGRSGQADKEHHFQEPHCEDSQ